MDAPPPADASSPPDSTVAAEWNPGHPWHYLRDGDYGPPVPFADIPASPADEHSFSHAFPKHPVRRAAKARQLLEAERAALEERRQRYEDILQRGAEALSNYDRTIAHDDDEMAVAESLSLLYNQIAWYRGRIAFLEAAQAIPAPRRRR